METLQFLFAVNCKYLSLISSPFPDNAVNDVDDISGVCVPASCPVSAGAATSHPDYTRHTLAHKPNKKQ